MTLRRAIAKAKARERRSARWWLVHAAGCAVSECALVLQYKRDQDFTDIPPGVRIPRSLRHVYESMNAKIREAVEHDA